ncbi:cytochrome C [Defluviimonas sp. 20V17]|uniref:Cytochrome c1 n=2 Tax=Allgaiera indica TaxID=765699 RepID=A0AAN4ZYS5_9RHOB|nr:cytochrome C [Defluviimonas sp. 20V17]GHD98677.1 cytochrome c [Allgaiera indica]
MEMIRKIVLTTALSVLALAAPFALTASETGNVALSATETSHADAQAAADQNAGGHAQSHVTDVAFPFEGPFGVYDRNQLQRGLQVYTEVCSACHGLKYVPIRTLGDKGGPELPAKQVRAYAANLAPVDDPETGESRDRKASDFFPKSSDPQAPDLSLMAKARKGFSGPYGLGVNQLIHGIGGPEYIYSILTGYTGKTKEQAGKTFYQNRTFPGGWIAMPPPLQKGQVEFADGSPNDVPHMAKDVAAFLMWTAEPKLDSRKKTGFLAVIFLGILATLLYLTNKKLWAPIKRKQTRL